MRQGSESIKWSDVLSCQNIRMITKSRLSRTGSPVRAWATASRQIRRALGFKGIYVDSPDCLASAWQEGLASDRPVVIEVKADPEVVPLPPHLRSKLARGFMASIVKGDEGAGHIISETAKQVVDGLFGKKE